MEVNKISYFTIASFEKAKDVLSRIKCEYNLRFFRIAGEPQQLMGNHCILTLVDLKGTRIRVDGPWFIINDLVREVES